MTVEKHELLELARPHYEAPQLALLQRSIGLAATAHERQTRASGEPYLIHPLAVAAILIEWKLDIDSVMAGVLHDTWEETWAFTQAN